MKVPPLSGTAMLEWDDDIASRLVTGVDRFLLGELEVSPEGRRAHWRQDLSSPEKYNQSIGPNRRRLAHILGVREERGEFDAPELVATTGRSASRSR